MMRKKKTRIADDVFTDLQSSILSGAYKAGDRLPPERELSATLGTNRNTLREAIRKLEQFNLVTVRQGQGVTVSDFRRSATIHVLEPFLIHGEDPIEKARALMDLLAARIVVLEYATRLAVQRADATDLARLRDVRQLLLSAFRTQDREALAIGYQQWLTAVVDAAHSLPTRWIANPFLELNRTFMERFPSLWVLDESFPEYLEATEQAVRTGNTDAALEANRTYYERIDAVVINMLEQLFVAGDGSNPDPEME